VTEKSKIENIQMSSFFLVLLGTFLRYKEERMMSFLNTISVFWLVRKNFYHLAFQNVRRPNSAPSETEI
jgi:Na+/serine symporter